MSHKDRPTSTTSLTAIIFILILFGLIMLASASSVIGYLNFSDNYYYLKHQLLYGFLPGLILFFICSKINYKFWQKNAHWLLLTTILLLVLVFVPKIGLELNRAKSWIKIGEATFQPAEIIKLTLIIYLAAWFSKSKEHIKSFSQGLLPFLILLGIIAALIALQPDIGTMSIVVMIAMGVYFIAGLKWSYFMGLILASGGLLFLLIKIDPDGRRLNRIITFLNPTVDVQNISYHINQALLAIGSGGLFGLGLGHSRQKFEYLPQVAGDSIFAILAEELGFVFSVLFIIILVYFIIKIFKISAYSKNDFIKLFTVGLAIWIGGQSLINIGAMLGILPLTGVPLPFVSFGGTALMTLMAGCGILVNITKSLKH